MKTLLFAFSLIFSFSSFAADCKAEFKKLCPNSKDQRQSADCVQSKMADFSQACREQLVLEFRPKKMLKESCADEIQKHCDTMSPGCYQANRNKIPAECREQFDHYLSMETGSILESCMSDVEKNCPYSESVSTDPNGQAKYNECVKKSVSNFSPKCIQALGLDKANLPASNTKVIEKEKR